MWTDVPERFQPMMGEDLTGVPYLDVSVSATDDGKRLEVFLVNRYVDQALPVDLVFEGLRPPASGRLRQLAADIPFAQSDFERPDRLRILELDAPSSSKPELSTHSISVLLLG